MRRDERTRKGSVVSFLYVTSNMLYVYVFTYYVEMQQQRAKGAIGFIACQRKKTVAGGT